MSTQGWTATVADFVVSTTYEELGPEVVERATAPVIDAVGVMVGGAADEAGQAILRYAASVLGDLSSRARFVPWTGSLPGLAPETSALVSSTLAHALDFDDVLPGAGHPSGPVTSAILAAAGDGPLDGRRFLEAYAVGIEVMRGLSRAVGPGHYRHGWHTTSTIGGFAAAAAAAKVHALDRRQVAMALGIAASVAGGLQRNFGTATKPLHSGVAARNGVQAVELVRHGFTASTDILEGPRGFFDVYGVGASRPEELSRLGRPFALVDPGISLKRFACCFEVYRPIEAVLELRDTHDVVSERVEELVCTVPPGTLGPLINRWPDDGVEAKFSMEYALAAALVDGGITLGTFTDGAVARPAVRAVLPRLRIVEDVRVRPEDPEGLNSSASSGGFAEVTARLTGGDEATARVHVATGTPSRPLPRTDLFGKFVVCLAAAGVSGDAAEAVFARLERLDTAADVPGLLADLRS